MPSLGMMTINALAAADSVVIPSQPSFLSAKGLDISGYLSRYAADEDITDVWIWYECIGENKYLIYIGYV